jgi:hypothetical protein
VRRVAAWLAWFAGLYVLWLLLVGFLQDVELITGLGAAAVAATAAEVVRAQGLLPFKVEGRWGRQVWKPLLRVVPEFFFVLGVLFRRPRGSFRTLDFPVGGERAVDKGRRAFAVVAASFAPNRLVVDADPETGGVLVHDLLPSRASDELL